MTLHVQFAKSLLSGFVYPFGTTLTNLEISDEPRFVDIYFEPSQDPGDLGWLGQMAWIPCLIEPFRNPVDEKGIQLCLLRTLLVGAKQRGRKRP